MIFFNCSAKVWKVDGSKTNKYKEKESIHKQNMTVGKKISYGQFYLAFPFIVQEAKSYSKAVAHFQSVIGFTTVCRFTGQ